MRERIARTSQLAEQARAVAAETREKIQQSRTSVAQYRLWRVSKGDQIVVSLEASGEYATISSSDRLQADELRRWLRHHGCRVGPLSNEPAARVAFVAYQRRDEVRMQLERHPRCRIEP